MKYLSMNKLLAVLAAALLAGCAATDVYRVGTYNIRLAHPEITNFDGANNWEARKAGLAEQVRRLDLDAFGMQEVTPCQAAYLREQLPEFEFVGEHRAADRKSDEASPVAYRKNRFIAEKSGTFWLSETPDVPGKKGWGAACPRVCSYLILRDRTSGQRFCFANTHTDHISAEAREKGMLLILERMKKFGKGAPIVFTGDHNCRYDDAPAKAVRKILDDARDVSEKQDPGTMNTFQGFGKYKDGPIDEGGKKYADYRIDYIYVTPGTRVLDFETHSEKRGEGNLFFSDHYPLTATISF